MNSTNFGSKQTPKTPRPGLLRGLVHPHESSKGIVLADTMDRIHNIVFNNIRKDSGTRRRRVDWLFAKLPEMGLEMNSEKQVVSNGRAGRERHLERYVPLSVRNARQTCKALWPDVWMSFASILILAVALAIPSYRIGARAAAKAQASDGLQQLIRFHFDAPQRQT